MLWLYLADSPSQSRRKTHHPKHARLDVIMNFTKLEELCPNCHKPDLWLHPAGRVCGCDNCKSVFSYPELEEKQILPEDE